MNMESTNSRDRFLTDMDQALLGHHAGVVVATREHARLDTLLAELAQTHGLRQVEWNSAFGEVDPRSKAPRLDLDESVPDLCQSVRELMARSIAGRMVVIADAALALTMQPRAVPALSQLLQRVARQAPGNALVVLVTPDGELPGAAQLPQLRQVRLHPPSETEVDALVAIELERHGRSVDEALAPKLRQACMGLGQDAIRSVLTQAALDDMQNEERIMGWVHREKGALIAGSSPLQIVPPVSANVGVGGLELLGDWLRERARVFADRPGAGRQRVRLPKGVLIAGMPGCGKSLTAKVSAHTFGLPLLKLDVGSLLGRYVGDSEANMRAALTTAEAMSPCILWMDELEKAFSGVTNGQASEVSMRLVGYLLTWMQDNTRPVFVVATANDVTVLPPELLRKGRFDEVFYVDFPNLEERSKIFGIHLGDAWEELTAEDRDALCSQTRDFSGADIEMAVNEARLKAFIAGRELEHHHLQQAVHETVPLGQTLRPQIRKSQERFAELKLRPASRTSGNGHTLVRLQELAKGPSELQRLTAACYGDTTDDILEALALDESGKVRRAVLEHPHCPETVLVQRMRIGREDPQYDRNLFAAACCHLNTPADLLAEYVRTERVDEALGKQLLAWPNCPPEVLQALSERFTDRNTGLAVAEHPKCPPNLLEQMVQGQDAPLRRAAAKHPSLPVKLRRSLMESMDPDVLGGLAQHPDCTAQEREACKQVAAGLESIRDGNEATIWLFLSQQEAPLDERLQRALADSTNLLILKQLSARPELAPDLQTRFAGRADLAEALAGNPRLTPEVQERLLTGEAPSIIPSFSRLASVVVSMWAPGAILGIKAAEMQAAKYLRADHRMNVARLLADNPGLDLRLVGLVAKAGGDAVCPQLAARPDLPLEWGDWLAAHAPNAEVLSLLATNPQVAAGLNEDFANAVNKQCDARQRLEIMHSTKLSPAVKKFIGLAVTEADVRVIEQAFIGLARAPESGADESDPKVRQHRESVQRLRTLLDLARATVAVNAARRTESA